MKTFKYQARTLNGSLQKGHLSGESRDRVAQALIDQDLFPIVVEAVDSNHQSGVLGALPSSVINILKPTKLDAQRLATLAQSLSDLLSAGMTLQRALDQLVKQIRDRRLSRILKGIAAEVRGGQTLSHALSQFRHDIPLSFIGALESGESAGNLEKVLEGLAKMYEQESSLRTVLRNALVYPSIVVTVAIGTLSVLFVFLLPRLAVLYQDMAQELPASTKLLLKTADICQAWGGWIAVGIIAIVAGVQTATRRSGALHMRLARQSLFLPIVGPLLLLREVLTFSQAMFSLIGGGVPLRTALTSAARSSNNIAFRADIQAASKQIVEGIPLSQALTGTLADQGNLCSLVQIGEEQGDLAAAMERATTLLRADMTQRTKTLTTVLEPVLIVGLGLVVAFIVFAMMVPIMEIQV